MNATQWTVIGIIGLAVLGVIGLFVKEKFDAAKINQLEQKNAELGNAAQVGAKSDADLLDDVSKILGPGNPKT